MLTKLQFRPGINRDNTSYSNEGGWYDCDKVRFRRGFPQTIGGWTSQFSEAADGVCRCLFGWNTLQGGRLLGIGTHKRLYIESGGVLYDITPLRLTTAAGDATFSASNGSTTLTVTEAAHGAAVGDLVVFADAVSLGGAVTADVLNSEHEVTAVNSADEFEVELAAAANGSDTGNGGANVVAQYLVSTGLIDPSFLDGYGTGGYGLGPYGEPSSAGVGFSPPRIWSMDGFGEDLIANINGGNIYYHDFSAGLTARAVPFEDLAGAQSAPTIANRIVVSDQDRHVIAFGCDPTDDIGTQDTMLIRWSDQENPAEWRTLSTTTAGSKRLDAGSRIITAVEARREIIVFTDSAIYAMQFVGPPFIFAFQDLSRNVKIVGPNAGTSVDGVVYWMENGRFMAYDGNVRELDCPVADYIFDRLNKTMFDKVYAGINAQFSEVWWLYPSGDENDSYVIFNYAENAWSYGTLDRTAWQPAGVFEKPLAISSGGQIYSHEDGITDGSTNPSSAIESYIESSPVDIGDGERFMFINRVIPDLRFVSAEANPVATVTVKTEDYPGTGTSQQGSNEVTGTGAEYTNQLYYRLRGRSFIFRFASDDENTSWELGSFRIDYRQDGRR